MYSDDDYYTQPHNDFYEEWARTLDLDSIYKEVTKVRELNSNEQMKSTTQTNSNQRKNIRLNLTSILPIRLHGKRSFSRIHDIGDLNRQKASKSEKGKSWSVFISGMFTKFIRYSL